MEQGARLALLLRLYTAGEDIDESIPQGVGVRNLRGQPRTEHTRVDGHVGRRMLDRVWWAWDQGSLPLGSGAESTVRTCFPLISVTQKVSVAMPAIFISGATRSKTLSSKEEGMVSLSASISAEQDGLNGMKVCTESPHRSCCSALPGRCERQARSNSKR